MLIIHTVRILLTSNSTAVRLLSQLIEISRVALEGISIADHSKNSTAQAPPNRKEVSHSNCDYVQSRLFWDVEGDIRIGSDNLTMSLARRDW